MAIDLNADIGESYGQYKIGNDDEVIKHITSANIACGYHAGDHNVLHRTVKLAVENNVDIGAHPGLPDLMGFGRREMKVAGEDVYNMVVYQIGAIQGFTELYEVKLHHIKPHGALYNMAARDTKIAQSIVSAVKSVAPSSILYGLAGSELISAGKNAGLRVAEEVFADRTYQRDGTLTPRTHPNAMIHNSQAALFQAIQMVRDGVVTTVDGSVIPIKADTICVHGDEPKAVTFVKLLRTVFDEQGIQIKSLGGKI